MLKTIITTTFILVSLLSVNSTASAQGGARFVNAKDVKVFENNSLADADMAGTERLVSLISPKVSRAFSKSFPGVSPEWYSINNQYLARFTSNGKTTHALYTNKGHMEYSVSRGSEAILPANVKRLVKDSYKNYNIQFAWEVKSLGITAWMASLVSDSSIIIVKVIDNELVESTTYGKSNKQ